MATHKPGHKAALVREAYDALGPDVKFAQLRDHVREKHNVEIPESLFYAERSRRRAAAATPTTPTPTPVQVAKPAMPPSPNVLDVVQTVKRLIQTCGGKEQLKAIIDEV